MVTKYCVLAQRVINETTCRPEIAPHDFGASENANFLKDW